MTITQIHNKAYFLANTNSTDYASADVLISTNNAYERVASLILQSDGRWEWDDSNNTDFAIATTTVTSAQQDYALATTHLKIKRVELQDTNGNWTQLFPLDEANLKGVSLTEFMSGGGIPFYYDFVGSSVFLYPTPNYTQAASLKVYFQRGPALYTSGEVTTGTKEPGFNSLYHDLIAYWVAYDYAVAKGKANAKQLRQEIQLKEQGLQEDYANRNQNDPPRFVARHTTRR